MARCKFGYQEGRGIITRCERFEHKDNEHEAYATTEFDDSPMGDGKLFWKTNNRRCVVISKPLKTPK